MSKFEMIIQLKDNSFLNYHNLQQLYMSVQQHQEISSYAEDFDPTAQKQQANYQEQYQSSSDSYEEEEKYSHGINIIKKGPNQQPTSSEFDEHKHHNMNKINQKICLNKLQACQNQQLVKQKRHKDKAQRATVQQVLDPRTMAILAKFIRNGTFTQVNGCLSTGKQANVYHAQCLPEGEQMKKQYAVKIYKTSILIFKDRDRYVQGEFRFRKGYCSSNPRKMVKMWAEKQFRNLKRIQGVLPCPIVHHVKSNVLVMDFLGDDGIPAPKLKDIEKNQQQFSQIYLELLIDIRILYQECQLVHADLSEYNLLFHKNKIYIIDVSQSVEHDHPHSLEFLRRDIVNVNDFFNKKGVRVFSDRHVFDFVVSLDIPKGKQREALDEIIQNYDDTVARDEIFNRIKIHQNLANISMQKVQQQIFGEKNQNSQYHHAVTGIKNPKGQSTIKEQDSDSSSDSDEQSSSENPQQQKQKVQGQSKEDKTGGKQKYEGLSKLQRKHKVKEQKRQKRKQKMPKKMKKKMMKK